MSNISHFSFEQQAIRTVLINDNPWFIASDVCSILSIQNVTQALSKLDDDERSMFNIGRQGEANIINESGLYALILRSRKKEARSFRKWVTSEVLPTIRKTGSYQVKPKPTTKALPNCLTAEQQKAIQALVKSRAESIPDQSKWAGATIKQYSALKSKFGVGYKEIPESQFSNALNVLARVVIEGEILDAEPKGMKPLKWTKLTDDITSESGYAIICDVKNWVRENLPQEIGCDFFDAMHDLQRVITRSTTEMQEAINHFRVGVGYLNRFRNVK